MKYHRQHQFKKSRPNSRLAVWCLSTLTLVNLWWSTLAFAFDIPPAWLDLLKESGTVRVLVVLNVPFQPEGMLANADAIVIQRAEIAQAQQALLDSLQPSGNAETRFETIPVLVMAATEATLTQLQESPFVLDVQWDAPDETMAGRTVADQLKELERVYESSHSYAEVTEVTVSLASVQAGDVRELMVANLQSVGIVVARGEESSSGRQVRATKAPGILPVEGMLVAPAVAQTTTGCGDILCYLLEGNANDTSGNGAHGNVIDAILTSDSLGKLDSAYLFNGTSSHIDIPADLFAGVTAFSFIASIKSQGSQDSVILSKGTKGTPGYLELSQTTSGAVSFSAPDLRQLQTKTESKTEMVPLPYSEYYYPCSTHEILRGQAAPLDLGSWLTVANAANQCSTQWTQRTGLYDPCSYHAIMSATPGWNYTGWPIEAAGQTTRQNISVTNNNCSNALNVQLRQNPPTKPQTVQSTVQFQVPALLQAVLGGTLQDGMLHDLAITYGNGQLNLFLDSVLKGTLSGVSGSVVGLLTGAKSGDRSVRGNNQALAVLGKSFKGVIDNFSVYSQALSQTQLKQLYEMKLPKVVLTMATPRNGTVTSTGINCGTDCTEEVILNSQVAITATPATGYRLKAWGGDCTGSTSPVNITMDKAKNCTATFETNPVVLLPDCNNVPSGLVACWPLDGNTNDYSGNGNHGSANGGTWTTDSSGTANRAYGFNGSNSWIEVPHSSSLNPSYATFSAWVYPQGSARSIILGKAAFSNVYSSPYALTLESGNRPALGIRKNSSGCTQIVNPYIVYSSSVIPTGQWSMITGTWDGSTLKIYINGVETGRNSSVPSGAIDTCPSPYPYGNEPNLFRMGVALSSDLLWFNGKLDNVRIYNRALSEAEIKQLAGIVEPAKVTLTVTKSGNGTVTGTGINCGTDCTESFTAKTSVTLTASATTGAIFKQWSGACSGTSATTTVTLDQAKTCTATFDKVIPKYTLTVSKTGTGTGDLTGTGLTCGTDCTEDYVAKTLVTLTATPATGSKFVSWGGDCTGTTTTTTVTMTQAKSCTAHFIPENVTTFTLTVAKKGTGKGTLRAQVSGQTVSLVCNATCATGSYDYPLSSVVNVTATPATGSVFKGWSCDGNYRQTGTPTLIKVTMDVAMTCTAEFQ